MSRIDRAISELHEIDELAEIQSPVHAFSAAVKLLLTVIYILTVMSFPAHAFSELFLMFLYPYAVSALSGIPLRTAVRKMRYVLPLVMAVGIFDPFLNRQVLFTLYGIPVTAGILSMFTLMLKGVLCLLASFLLIATTPADALFASLRRFHVPAPAVTLLLLTWRYITVLAEEVSVMTTAYHLRAPQQKGIHISAWGSFLGQLLLRTIDRGQELYESMLLRGYHGDFPTVNERKTGPKDLMYLFFWVIFFVIIRFFNIAELLGRGVMHI